MPINITMPALSPTMEEGTLAKWLVKEGDTVAAGDVVAEIETDKATMEVEAVDEGTVAKLVVPAGAENVKVNAVIAVLAAEGEDVSAAAKNAGGGEAAAEPEKKAEGPSGKPAAQPSTDKAETARPSAPAPAPADSAVDASPDSDRRSDGERVFSSPLARRIAKEAGIDIASVKGSGPHGRIVQRDVEAAKIGRAHV